MPLLNRKFESRFSPYVVSRAFVRRIRRIMNTRAVYNMDGFLQKALFISGSDRNTCPTTDSDSFWWRPSLCSGQFSTLQPSRLHHYSLGLHSSVMIRWPGMAKPAEAVLCCPFRFVLDFVIRCAAVECAVIVSLDCNGDIRCRLLCKRCNGCLWNICICGQIAWSFVWYVVNFWILHVELFEF